MDKKDEAIKTLKDIRSISHNIRILEDEIATMYSSLTSTAIKLKDVNVQTSGSPDPLGDKMSKLIEYQAKVKDYQVELYNKKSKVLDVIKRMEAEDQELIMLRYFKGMTVEYTAEYLDMSYFGMWKKLNRTEEKFCQIYEEIFNS